MTITVVLPIAGLSGEVCVDAISAARLQTRGHDVTIGQFPKPRLSGNRKLSP